MILLCDCIIVISVECNVGYALVSYDYVINMRLIICELQFIILPTAPLLRLMQDLRYFNFHFAFWPWCCSFLVFEVC